MSEHSVHVHWDRITPGFDYDTFDRTHTLTFGGGLGVTASSAPDFLGRKEFANPEEMLAAAVASCHMLTFLAIAAKSRYTVDDYEGESVAILDKNPEGRLAVVKIILRPKVKFSGDRQPNADQLEKLHEKAHQNCFIANSVRCPVAIEG